jgi:hypothetical protein
MYENLNDEELLRLSTENLAPTQQQAWAVEVKRRGYRLVLVPVFFNAVSGTVAVNPWKRGDVMRIRGTAGHG